MAMFNLENFVNTPTLEQFDICRKDDLCVIAAHYDITVSKSLVKQELKSIILSGLVDKSVFLKAGTEQQGRILKLVLQVWLWVQDALRFQR